ncbi:MAG: biopolymer transporter ExbD [Caulobacterales bacterium]|nr:biopolymer transporter ExbD [Caulobacterales bacterium]
MGAKLGGAGGGNKYDLGQNSDINVTPFVDIMLVLLIIFMVAAPMATVSIALDLPPAIPPKPGDPIPKKPVIVSVQPSGAVFVNAVQSGLPNLTVDIPEAMRKQGTTANFTDERVFVQASAEVTYEQFMAVLNALQADGYYKIGLVNEDIS